MAKAPAGAYRLTSPKPLKLRLVDDVSTFFAVSSSLLRFSSDVRMIESAYGGGKQQEKSVKDHLRMIR